MPLTEFHCQTHREWMASCPDCQDVLHDMRPENYAPQDIQEGDTIMLTLEHARGSIRLNADLGQGHIQVSRNVETQKDWVLLQETCQRAIAGMVDILRDKILDRDTRQIQRYTTQERKD